MRRYSNVLNAKISNASGSQLTRTISIKKGKVLQSLQIRKQMRLWRMNISEEEKPEIAIRMPV